MRYIKKTILFTLFLTLSLYLLVLSFDVYDEVGINPWGLTFKGVSNARDNKFSHINSGRYQYKMFVLGSSRVLRFDPNLIEKLTGLKTYNYGLENANVEELLAVTKHIISTQKPKEILLMLDFYMLNNYIGTDKRFLKSRLYPFLGKKVEKKNFELKNFLIYPSYFTLKAIYDTFKVISLNIREEIPEIYLANGQHVKEHAVNKPRLAIEYFSNQYKNYHISKKRVEYLKTIKRICDKNHIKLIVALSPMKENHLAKVLQNNNLKENFLKFKKITLKIFGKIYDFNNFSVKKYKENKYWYDSVHPTEILSNIMVNNIFSKNSNPKFPEITTLKK